jgi:hypothetical protein
MLRCALTPLVSHIDLGANQATSKLAAPEDKRLQFHSISRVSHRSGAKVYQIHELASLPNYPWSRISYNFLLFNFSLRYFSFDHLRF